MSKKKIKDFTQFEIDCVCDKHWPCATCPFYKEESDIYYCEVKRLIKTIESEIEKQKEQLKTLKELLEKEIEVEEDD
ncbi:MAG: hypothetical protein IKT40_03460 [Bacilli bacterium]|nr:hypothetical protein [Bacilli bacterium]